MKPGLGWDVGLPAFPSPEGLGECVLSAVFGSSVVTKDTEQGVDQPGITVVIKAFEVRLISGPIDLIVHGTKYL
jgi:hypothetical protein